MRHLCWGWGLLCLLVPGWLHAQTADDIAAKIKQLVELDSIDLANAVKFRPGLLPALHELDADESGMQTLADPYAPQLAKTPGAAGWYRVTIVVPDKIGKFALPANGYNLGVESNVLGGWEIYTYKNDKPAGAAMIPTVTGVWHQGNVLANSNQPATAWMSNAPLPTKPGDRLTIAILATSQPFGAGSPTGFALRHLRLRYALRHTGARAPFYTALNSVHDKLKTLQGEELQAYQARVKDPLTHLDAVIKSADSGNLNDLTAAMQTWTKDLNAALKK